MSNQGITIPDTSDGSSGLDLYCAYARLRQPLTGRSVGSVRFGSCVRAGQVKNQLNIGCLMRFRAGRPGVPSWRTSCSEAEAPIDGRGTLGCAMPHAGRRHPATGGASGDRIAGCSVFLSSNHLSQFAPPPTSGQRAADSGCNAARHAELCRMTQIETDNCRFRLLVGLLIDQFTRHVAGGDTKPIEVQKLDRSRLYKAINTTIDTYRHKNLVTD